MTAAEKTAFALALTMVADLCEANADAAWEELKAKRGNNPYLVGCRDRAQLLGRTIRALLPPSPAPSP